MPPFFTITNLFGSSFTLRSTKDLDNTISSSVLLHEVVHRADDRLDRIVAALDKNVGAQHLDQLARRILEDLASGGSAQDLGARAGARTVASSSADPCSSTDAAVTCGEEPQPQWMGVDAAGAGELLLAFDTAALPGGYGAPFELRDLQLQDQGRMAPIESRAVAVRF